MRSIGPNLGYLTIYVLISVLTGLIWFLGMLWGQWLKCWGFGLLLCVSVVVLSSRVSASTTGDDDILIYWCSSRAQSLICREAADNGLAVHLSILLLLILLNWLFVLSVCLCTKRYPSLLHSLSLPFIYQSNGCIIRIAISYSLDLPPM